MKVKMPFINTVHFIWFCIKNVILKSKLKTIFGMNLLSYYLINIYRFTMF